MSIFRNPIHMKQTGFSMVELMVALVLGLFLTVAVLQTFIGAKQAYEYQQEFSRIQENGRFAMIFLTKDIRAADFWGCNSAITVKSNLVGDVNAGQYAAGILGSDAVPSSTSGYAPVLGPLADAIVIQGGRGGGISVIQTGSSGASSAQIKLDKLNHPLGSTIADGDILMVSDCSNAEIFQVTSIQNSNVTVVHGTGGGHVPGNQDNFLDDFFGDDAQVFIAEGLRYWLRPGTSGEPALVRGSERDLWSGGDELVEGVENLQILYGVDSTGDKTPNYFVPADQVSSATTSMSDVVSVQVHLLVRSLRDNMLDEPRALEYYGLSRVANDRRLRKAFTSTVAIRNRQD